VRTMTPPIVEPLVTCAMCRRRVVDDADAVLLADRCFHAWCVPHCEACDRGLARELENDWAYQVIVVSSSVGYEMLSIRHLCASCRESTLTAEPSPQD
jgi:hypothetical protein